MVFRIIEIPSMRASRVMICIMESYKKSSKKTNLKNTEALFEKKHFTSEGISTGNELIEIHTAV